MTIEITKRQVIATLEEGGEHDLLQVFADLAMSNARDDMNSEHESVSHYEVTDAIGSTEVTIRHLPHSATVKELTVNEAKDALAAARKRERASHSDEAQPAW